MAKKSTQSNENTTTKQKKSTTKTKEPLVSTRKKVGIAIYFTFLATLAGVIGVQILISQNFGEPLNPTDTYSTTVTEDTQKPIDNTKNNQTTNYSNYPIDENAPNHNVATPFDSTATTQQTQNNQVDNQSQTYPNATSQQSSDFTSTSPACPDGNCGFTTLPAKPDGRPVVTQIDCPDGNCVTTEENCPDGNCVVTETCNDGNCTTTTTCENGNCTTTTTCDNCNC